jgi:type II secretory pathway pseudopilin PulG
VLFTDVLDALEDKAGAVNFYIDHELGHIHRQHLIWGAVLFPAKMLPLLGSALRQAEEYSCDRYGTSCFDSDEDVIAALAAIAAGDTRWKTINVPAYLGQVRTTSGFWMSFNELTGDYPWLTKQMATALALRQGKEITHPRRHWFAWFLSIFIPRLGGGFASLIVTVAIIGVLAAVVIPAYQDYTIRAQVTGAYNIGAGLRGEIAHYASEHQAWPTTLVDLGYAEEVMRGLSGGYELEIYDGGMVGIDVGADKTGERKYVVIEPSISEEGEVRWNCYGQNLEPKYLPIACR